MIIHMKSSSPILLERIERAIYSIRRERGDVGRRSCSALWHNNQGIESGCALKSRPLSGGFHVSDLARRGWRIEPVTNCDRFAETSRSTVSAICLYRTRNPNVIERLK